VLTQKYNAIVKDFRENVSMLVLFYDKDKESREAAFKENDIGLSNDEKDRIVKELKDRKRSKVVLRLMQPFHWHLVYGVQSTSGRRQNFILYDHSQTCGLLDRVGPSLTAL